MFSLLNLNRYDSPYLDRWENSSMLRSKHVERQKRTHKNNSRDQGNGRRNRGKTIFLLKFPQNSNL
jgi:hypothetical protein